jgi:hypothetical protein
MGRAGTPGWRETRVTGDDHEPMSAFGGEADITCRIVSHIGGAAPSRPMLMAGAMIDPSGIF